jgi:hypothetical protein
MQGSLEKRVSPQRTLRTPRKTSWFLKTLISVSLCVLSVLGGQDFIVVEKPGVASEQEGPETDRPPMLTENAAVTSSDPCVAPPIYPFSHLPLRHFAPSSLVKDFTFISVFAKARLTSISTLKKRGKKCQKVIKN